MVRFCCISAECPSRFLPKLWQDWQRNAPQKKNGHEKEGSIGRKKMETHIPMGVPGNPMGAPGRGEPMGTQGPWSLNGCTQPWKRSGCTRPLYRRLLSFHVSALFELAQPFPFPSPLAFRSWQILRLVPVGWAQHTKWPTRQRNASLLEGWTCEPFEVLSDRDVQETNQFARRVLWHQGCSASLASLAVSGRDGVSSVILVHAPCVEVAFASLAHQLLFQTPPGSHVSGSGVDIPFPMHWRRVQILRTAHVPNFGGTDRCIGSTPFGKRFVVRTKKYTVVFFNFIHCSPFTASYCFRFCVRVCASLQHLFLFRCVGPHVDLQQNACRNVLPKVGHGAPPWFPNEGLGERRLKVSERVVFFFLFSFFHFFFSVSSFRFHHFEVCLLCSTLRTSLVSFLSTCFFCPLFSNMSSNTSRVISQEVFCCRCLGGPATADHVIIRTSFL